MTSLTANLCQASAGQVQLRRRAAGFTLVELMIGAALSSFILAGVLSTFLFLGRSGANVQNYNDMEAQSRKCLELFAEDVRQANAITWASSTSITLAVNSTSVTYAYDGAAKQFVRTDAVGSRTLLTGLNSFAFKAYTITGTEIIDFSSASALANAGSSTKQLQLVLASMRSHTTVVNATNTVLSARFILRNKRVTT